MEGTTLDSSIQPYVTVSEKRVECSSAVSEKMAKAQAYFRDLGLPFDSEGLITPNLSPQQIQQLVQYRNETFQDSLEMPTEADFYKKTLLAVSLWRQTDGHLLGKGIGVEVAVQGTAVGRVQRTFQPSYRTHSDFEFYGVKDGSTPAEKNNLESSRYPKEFRAVFGSQEIFPPTQTKGLTNLPSDLLENTAQVVDLGGVKVIIPELELLFLDKWEKPGEHSRPEGSDAAVLAEKYVLDRSKVHQYLDAFVIDPQTEKLGTEAETKLKRQQNGIKRNIADIKQSFSEDEISPTSGQLVDRLNENIEQFAHTSNEQPSGISVSGVSVDDWVHISSGQIDSEGNIVDPVLLEQIKQKIEQEKMKSRAKLSDKHAQLDQLFTEIETKYSRNES